VPINVVLTFFLRIAFFLCHVSFISAARTTDHNRPQMTTNDPTFLLFKLDGLQCSTNLHGEMGRVESFGYCTVLVGTRSHCFVRLLLGDYLCVVTKLWRSIVM
jgi:hypothetical protein